MLPASPVAAVSVILYGKTVMISAFRTFESEYLRTGAATASPVCQFYTLLMASGAKTASNAVELLLFLFEIVDVCKDRSCQYDDEEQQKIECIDGSLLRWYRYEVLLYVFCSLAYAARPVSRNFSGGVCVLCGQAHVRPHTL